MVVYNWLERYWYMIGQYLNGMRTSFGSLVCPQGNGVYEVETEFQTGKVWFTLHNPRNVPDDWSKINLVRVVPCEGGLNVVAEVKSDDCKVSWFIHS